MLGQVCRHPVRPYRFRGLPKAGLSLSLPEVVVFSCWSGLTVLVFRVLLIPAHYTEKRVGYASLPDSPVGWCYRRRLTYSVSPIGRQRARQPVSLMCDNAVRLQK